GTARLPDRPNGRQLVQQESVVPVPGAARRGRRPHPLGLQGWLKMRRHDKRLLMGLAGAILVVFSGQFVAYKFGYGAFGAAPSHGGEATLAEIANGRFPTAYDKSGGGGKMVTVHHVVFHYVQEEVDGDWHMGASDPT